MAVEWLDVARYGDTDGLFEDHPRSIYPWRDWVVDAFNSNLPYNDFITWQVAGDLLPGATVAQRTATGFLRNNPTSNEGGIIEEDYRVKYLVDRVNTTATAMLGLTLECAQCHDHKYDPMTQREYYQFAGFFNNIIGRGNTKGSTAPILRNLKPKQTLRVGVIDKQLAMIGAKLKSTPTKLTADFEKWLQEIEKPALWQTPQLVLNDSWHDKDGWLVADTKEKPGTKNPLAKPAMQGQYVRIALPKDRVGFLTISEVQIFSGGNNIAPAGKTSQSSVDFASPAAKATDGNHDGSFESCSCTGNTKDSWWEIDLGASYPIDSVIIWNRSDCCPERLNNVVIQVLDDQRAATTEWILENAAFRNAQPEDSKTTEKTAKDVRLAFSLSSGSLAAIQLESKSPALVEVLSARLLPAKNADKKNAGKPVPIKLAGNRRLKLNGKPVVVGLDAALKVTDGQQLELLLRLAVVDSLRVSTTDDQNAMLLATLPTDRKGRLKHFRGSWIGFRESRQQQATLTKEKKTDRCDCNRDHGGR